MTTNQKLLASLPSVDEMLKSEQGAEWQQSFPRRYVLRAIREIIEDYRNSILKNELADFSPDILFSEIQTRLEILSEFSLRPVINATGIVIHTNLGRSVLTDEILENVKSIACNYSNLEYDIEHGVRGKRHSHIQKLLGEITGAETGLAVNNNAAAVLVCLSALAKSKEVIVSRGELVEIGGSFRVPDVMSSSGAILREVGTTNKTHIYDYEKAINEDTALLLKVHQSNFKMSGFTSSVSNDELVALGNKHKIPVMFDLGSGCLVDLKPHKIRFEPSVQEIIKSGMDIVTFSGDKLLGGPQGGIIVGKQQFIEIIAKDPLMRAVRIDKMTLAALQAVLMIYLDENAAWTRIPTLRMLFQPIEKIKEKAELIASQIKTNHPRKDAMTAEVIKDMSQAGGGSLPEVEFQTFAVAIKPLNVTVNSLEEKLRKGNPPVVARIREDSLVIDPRTVQDSEIEVLISRIKAALI